MATDNQKNPSIFQGKVNDVLGGFTATPGPDFTSLMIQGQPQANPAIIADLQAIDARIAEVTTTKKAYRLAVANRKESSATDEAYLTSVVAALKVQLYGDQAALDTFGVEPSKPRTPASPKTNVAAAAKAAATRAARGTKSKKRRLAITVIPEPIVSVSGVASAPAAAVPSAGTALVAPAVPAAPAAK